MYHTKYNIEHLKQPSTQSVLGPIQDDEALLLYSIIQVMRYKNIIEIGFGCGDSAKNFLEAAGEDGHLVSIDINNFSSMRGNHTALCKSAKEVTSCQIPFDHADIIFYDCHNLDAQMTFHDNMVNAGIINDNTLLALHDTGLHPYEVVPCYEIEGGWVHQPVERKMVNLLVDQGWSAICFNTEKEIHGESLPYRHGITIMKKFKPLPT